VNRVPFTVGDPLYRRAQRPGHHSQREAPIHYLWTSSQADLVISDVKLEGLGSEFRLAYRGEDLGLFQLMHRRACTMSQCGGSRGCRAVFERFQLILSAKAS